MSHFRWYCLSHPHPVSKNVNTHVSFPLLEWGKAKPSSKSNLNGTKVAFLHYFVQSRLTDLRFSAWDSGFWRAFLDPLGKWSSFSGPFSLTSQSFPLLKSWELLLAHYLISSSWPDGEEAVKSTIGITRVCRGACCTRCHPQGYTTIRLSYLFLLTNEFFALSFVPCKWDILNSRSVL